MIVRSAGFCGESRFCPVVACACAGTMLVIGAGARAQDLPSQSMQVSQTTTPPPTAPEEAAAVESTPVEDQKQVDDKFHVSFTPYVWLPSLSGEVHIKGRPIDVDASFFDIVNDSNTVFGLMGALEFQHERVLVQFNGAWTYVESESNNRVAEDVRLKADITTQTTWLELFGGYRILDRGLAEINDKRRFTFDAFGGCRLTILDADTDATVKGTITLPDGETVTGKASNTFDEEKVWAEGFIGLRTGVDITERFEVSLRGDIGGFGIAGSEFSWQFIGGIGYTFHVGSWDGAALLGFRALSQDYEDGQFQWDVITYGPIIGVRFTF